MMDLHAGYLEGFGETGEEEQMEEEEQEGFDDPEEEQEMDEAQLLVYLRQRNWRIAG